MELVLLLIPLCIFLLAYVMRGDRGFKPPEVSQISEVDLKAFEAAPSLFVNNAEATLFRYIAEALPASHHLHSKVRLEDIIRVKRGLPGAARWAARGRVKSRHVDYLITTRSGDIILAIELDGASHNPEAPSEADKVKTALFQAAGVTLRRYRVGENFRHISAAIADEMRAELKSR